MKNILLARVYWNNEWPKQLESGVMFFNGQRITIEEFYEGSK